MPRKKPAASLEATTADPTQVGSNRDVTVTIPSRLKVSVANALLDRANKYEDGEIRSGLYTLAGMIDSLSATGMADPLPLYDRVAKATGLKRDDVKKVAHALAYGG